MATYQTRKGRTRAIIRRRGYPTFSKTFRIKAEAQRWARQEEAKLDGSPQAAASVNTETVKDVFTRYAREVSTRKKGARWEDLRINLILVGNVKRAIKPARWAYKRITRVTPQDIQDWRDERLKAVSAASVNREMNLVSGIFTHAIKEWRLPLVANPVHLVKRPPKGKARERRVTPAELLLLQGEGGVPREGYGAVKDYAPIVFELGMETALRLGEMGALRWAGVNLEEGWVHVADSKNSDERYVPLTPRAHEILAKLPRRGELVFPVNVASLGSTYRKLRKKLGGLDGLRIHDTRHEATSRLAQKLNPLELAKVTGHRDTRSVMIYYNPTPAELVKKLKQ